MGMKRGFTLIELLVVVAILIILAAILLPIFANRTEEARIARMAAEIRNMRTAVLMFMADNGRLPTVDYSTNPPTEEFLNNPNSLATWRGPYLEKFPTTTPWGTNLTYNVDTTDNSPWGGTTPTCTGVDLSSYSQVSWLTIAVASTIPVSSIARLDQQLDDGDGTSLNQTGYICVDSTSTPTTIYVFLEGQP